MSNTKETRIFLDKGAPVKERFFSYLSRETTGGRYLPAIDGIRFLAIMLVVAMHAYKPAARVLDPLTTDNAFNAFWSFVIAPGGWGVPLFFCLSGFILGLPFARYHAGLGKKIPLKKYFWRRLTRLEPPYVVALTLFVVLRVYQADVANLVEQLPHYLASITYTHGFIYGDKSTIISPAWSLEVEVQFYILAPLLTSVFALGRRTRWIVLSAAISAFVSWHAFVAHLPRYNLLGHIGFFLCGFLLVDLFLFSNIYEVNKRITKYAWDGLVVVSIAAASFFWSYNWSAHTFVAPFVLLICVGVMRGGLTRAFFENRFIRITGGMCYTIYLLHRAIIDAVYDVILRRLIIADSFVLSFGIQIFIVLAAVLGISTLFFALIERPCMIPDWPQKLWSRWQSSRVEVMESTSD